MDELKTLGTFGLRTKRELWKAHTELSRVRHQARSLLALRAEDRSKKEPILLRSLARIGLVSSDATLDDVLNLKVSDLLARRFQTIVTEKFGFKTPYQARQAVIHGHMMIGSRKIDIPSYMVTVKEESEIKFKPNSTIADNLEKNKAQNYQSEFDDHTQNSDDVQSSDVQSSDVQSSDVQSSDVQSSDNTQSNDTSTTNQDVATNSSDEKDTDVIVDSVKDDQAIKKE